jgi:hypothetical protein
MIPVQLKILLVTIGVLAQSTRISSKFPINISLRNAEFPFYLDHSVIWPQSCFNKTTNTVLTRCAIDQFAPIDDSKLDVNKNSVEHCLAAWIKHIESHLATVAKLATRFSELKESWTRQSCTNHTRTGFTVATLGTKTVNFSTECDKDKYTRVSYWYDTITTYGAQIKTICPDNYYFMESNVTQEIQELTWIPKRVPLRWHPTCHIPMTECRSAWKAFTGHFETWGGDAKVNLATMYTEYFTTKRHEEKTGPGYNNETIFGIEQFLRWFNYAPTDSFFSGCAEAKIPFVENCFHKPQYYIGENYGKELQELSWPQADTFSSLNGSEKLSNIEELLGCDIWIDNFVLIAFPPKDRAIKARDICANDFWGDFQEDTTSLNGTAVYTYENITFKMFSTPIGER